MLLCYGDTIVDKLWYVEEKLSNIYLRLYWIKSGKATFHQNNRSQELKQNYLYAFPTTSPYSISHDPMNPLECTYLHIEITPYILTELIELDMADEPLLFHLLSLFSILGKETFPNIYGTIQQELTTCILTIFQNKEIFANMDSRLSHSLNFLFDNMDQQITVADLSAISGYHPKYYNTIFQENMGLTPYQFLTQYRMKHALTLLQNGNTITQTSLKVGYTDKESFSRMFKKTYGILPSKIKRDFLSL